MKKCSGLISFVIVIVACGLCRATVGMTYRARVMDIVDGNTIAIGSKIGPHGITLRPDGPLVLDAIRAPELDEPGGPEAKSFLEAMLRGKEISVSELTDCGKSRGAWIFCNHKGRKQNINLLMVQKGLARCAELHVHAMSSVPMKQAQNEAIRRKLGIWAKAKPQGQSKDSTSSVKYDANVATDAAVTSSQNRDSAKPTEVVEGLNPEGVSSVICGKAKEDCRRQVLFWSMLAAGIAACLGLCYYIRHRRTSMRW